MLPDSVQNTNDTLDFLSIFTSTSFLQENFQLILETVKTERSSKLWDESRPSRHLDAICFDWAGRNNWKGKTRNLLTMIFFNAACNQSYYLSDAGTNKMANQFTLFQSVWGQIIPNNYKWSTTKFFTKIIHFRNFVCNFKWGKRNIEWKSKKLILVYHLELVSKELNHFGVIADLFRQIRGHSSRFVLFCSFWRLFTMKMIKV